MQKKHYFFLLLISTFLISKSQSNCFFNIQNYSYLASTSTNTSTTTAPILADFNNDGKLDILSRNAVSNQLSLVLNSTASQFSFSAPTPFFTSPNIIDFAAADFNMDGNKDIIATLNSTVTQVCVLSGNGVGGFSSPTYYSLTSSTLPSKVKLGDVNNDGKMDAVVSSQFGYLTIFLNNATALLQQQNTTLYYSSSIGDFVIKDFDNDNLNDLILFNGTNNVGRLYKTFSTSNFTSYTTFTLSSTSNPTRFTSADFDGDGFNDLAVTGGFASTHLYLNNGLNDFNFQSVINTGIYTDYILSDDLNNDLKPDLIVHNGSVEAVSVIYNNGGNNYSPALSYFSGYSSTFSVGDINGDGYKEIVTSNNYNLISVLKNNINSFTGVPMSIGGWNNRSIASADFNQDGLSDIAYVDQNTNNLIVSINNTQNNFNTSTSYAVGTAPNDLLTADFNNDGKQDIAVTNVNSNNTSVLLGLGTGSFGVVSTYSGGGFFIKTADLNNDGKLDLISGNKILLNNGFGGFLAPTLNSNIIAPIYLADFDNDGSIDMFSNGSTYKGLGTGTFNSSASSSISTFSNCVTSGDFDNDGNIDIASAGNGLLRIFKGNGNLTFTTSVTYTVAGTQTCIVTADFNNDGDLDIATCNNINSNCSTFRGISSFSFSPANTFTTGFNPLYLTVGNFNSDNLIDLAFTNLYGATVSFNNSATITPSSTITVCQGTPITLTGNSNFGYSNSWNTGATTNSLSISTSGVYTYSLIGGSCTSSSTYSVNFLPTPAISVNSGSICLGNTFTITPSGANTYTFSSGTNTVSPALNSSYTITGTGLNGCVNSIGSISSVTVNATPTITVNSTSICNGQSFTITPSGANTYTYSSGSAIVSPSVNTTYTVTGTSLQGCVNSIGSVSSITVNAIPTITVNSGSICNGQSFTITPSGANTFTYSSGSAIVSPTTNATYTITGTSAQGCINSIGSVSSVTVDAVPIITLNNGTICNGQSFTITPSGANTYSYSSGTAVVSPTNNITYTVTGTSNQGCINSIGSVSSVTVYPLPIVLASTNNTLLCTGETASLSVTGASSYTWNTTENNSTIVVSPTIQTTYSVNGTDANGCVNTTTITQDVSLCTGINTLNNNSVVINVYPNPFNGKITIVTNGAKQNIQIFNALGSMIHNTNIEAEKTEIDLSNQSAGVYFIKIDGVIKKIIKE